MYILEEKFETNESIKLIIVEYLNKYRVNSYNIHIFKSLRVFSCELIVHFIRDWMQLNFDLQLMKTRASEYAAADTTLELSL